MEAKNQPPSPPPLIPLPPVPDREDAQDADVAVDDSENDTIVANAKTPAIRKRTGKSLGKMQRIFLVSEPVYFPVDPLCGGFGKTMEIFFCPLRKGNP